MTYKEVADLLITTGLPVTYLMWPEKEAPDLPYICYYYPNSNDEPADNINWAHITALNVELYTQNKDPLRNQKRILCPCNGWNRRCLDICHSGRGPGC